MLERLGNKHEMGELHAKESERSLEEGNSTEAGESLQIDSRDDDARLRNEKIERSFRRARQSLEASHYDDAINSLNEILHLSPGHELALQYKRGAVERRERALRISYHAERAEKLLASGDLPGTRTELEAVLALDHTHGMALRILEEVALKERQQLVLQYTEEGRTCLIQKNFDRALESLEKARALDPANIEVETLLRQAHSSKEQEARPRGLEERVTAIQGALNAEVSDEALGPAHQAPPEFPEKIGAEAQGYLKAQDFRLPLEAVEQGLEAHPGDEGSQALPRTAESAGGQHEREQAVAEVARQCEELGQANRFAEALQLLEKSLEQYQAEPVLLNLKAQLERDWEQGKRAEAIRHVARGARESMARGRFQEAVEMLEGAASQYSGDAALILLLGKAREGLQVEEREQAIERIGAEAQGYLKAQDFARALEVLEQGLKSYPGEEGLQALLQTAKAARGQDEREQAVGEIARQCEELGRANRFAEAIELVEKSLVQFEGNQALLELKKQLESGDREARDRSLEELTKISHDLVHVSDPAQLEALSERTVILARLHPTDSRIGATAEEVTQRLAARTLEVQPRAPVTDVGSVSLDLPPAAPEAAAYELGVQPVPLPETPSVVQAVSTPSVEEVRQRRSRLLLFPAIGVVMGVAGGLILARLLRKSLVEIRTVPEGVHVRINQQECVTPNCRFNLPAGSYQVEASMPGYQTKVTSFSVDTANPESAISLTLQPLPPPAAPTSLGTLVVEAGEDGVDVFLNDAKYDAKTSQGMLRIPLAENEYVVRVEKSGYQTPPAQRVRLVKGSEAKVTFKLVPLPHMSALVIHGATPLAQVVLDKDPIGTVEADGSFSYRVPPGQRGIRLTKDGYISVSLRKRFVAGKTVNLESEDVQQSQTVRLRAKAPQPRSGRLDAIAELRVAIDQQPRDPAGYINLALRLREKGDLDGAIAQFQKALRLQPDSAKAHAGLAKALDDKHDLDGAIAEYRKAVSFEPNLVTARYNLGVSLEAKGNIDAAIEELLKAVRASPGDAEAHYALGRDYYEKRDLGSAAAEYQRSVDLQPRNKVFQESLGHALLQKGDRQPALEHFRIASQLDPTNPMYRNEYQKLEKDLNH